MTDLSLVDTQRRSGSPLDQGMMVAGGGAATTHVNDEVGSRLRTLEAENESLRRRLLELEGGQNTPDEPVDRNGKVIVVASAKGGVGKSITASNLAMGLVEIYGRRTVLVDCNLSFGDQAVLLNVRASKGLMHLADVSSIDGRVAEDLLTSLPSGLSVVVSPPDPVVAEMISPTLVTDLVQLYRTKFDYVVVDTLPGLTELNLQLLEAADQILLVTTPEMNALAHTAQYLGVARDLGFHDKISLVLNRSNAGIGMNPIEAHLGMPVASTLVSAGAEFVLAANRGEALISTTTPPECPIVQNLQRMVEIVAGEPLPKHLQLAGPSAAARASRPSPRTSSRHDGRKWVLGGGLVAAGLAATIAVAVFGAGATALPVTPSTGQVAIAAELPAVASSPAAPPLVSAPANVQADLSSQPAAAPAQAPSQPPAAQAEATSPLPETRVEPAPIAVVENTAEARVDAEPSLDSVQTVEETAAPPRSATAARRDRSLDSAQTVEEPAPLPTGKLVAARQSVVSVHQAPSTSAPTVQLLPVGTTVEILDGTAVGNGWQWQRVRTADGSVGWVIALAIQR